MISQRMDAAASGRSAVGGGSGRHAGRTNLRGILAIQVIVAGLGATIVGLVAGGLDALSLLYGAALMTANGLWLYRGIERATRHEAGQQFLYRSAAFRFVFLLLALGAAFAAGLYLPWVAAGMLAAQAVVYVYGLAGVWRARPKNG